MGDLLLRELESAVYRFDIKQNILFPKWWSDGETLTWLINPIDHSAFLLFQFGTMTLPETNWKNYPWKFKLPSTLSLECWEKTLSQKSVSALMNTCVFNLFLTHTFPSPPFISMSQAGVPPSIICLSPEPLGVQLLPFYRLVCYFVPTKYIFQKSVLQSKGYSHPIYPIHWLHWGGGVGGGGGMKWKTGKKYTAGRKYPFSEPSHTSTLSQKRSQLTSTDSSDNR